MGKSKYPASCHPERQRVTESGMCGKCYGKAYYQRNRNKMRARAAVYNLQAKYNLTPESHAAMLADQNGLCRICKRPFADQICVDHCHTTGKVRALLCRNCNMGIGLFADDAALLQSAAAYVKEFEDVNGKFAAEGRVYRG